MPNSKCALNSETVCVYAGIYHNAGYNTELKLVYLSSEMHNALTVCVYDAVPTSSGCCCSLLDGPAY